MEADSECVHLIGQTMWLHGQCIHLIYLKYAGFPLRLWRAYVEWQRSVEGQGVSYFINTVSHIKFFIGDLTGSYSLFL